MIEDFNFYKVLLYLEKGVKQVCRSILCDGDGDGGYDDDQDDDDVDDVALMLPAAVSESYISPLVSIQLLSRRQ